MSKEWGNKGGQQQYWSQGQVNMATPQEEQSHEPKEFNKDEI